MEHSRIVIELELASFSADPGDLESVGRPQSLVVCSTSRAGMPTPEPETSDNELAEVSDLAVVDEGERAGSSWLEL